jgi:intracellular septation protein
VHSRQPAEFQLDPACDEVRVAMKISFDLLPAIVFFAFYIFGDIYSATAAIIVACVVQTFGYRFAAGTFDKAHLLTLGLAIAFGGATLALRDPEFIKIKPTLTYGLMGLAFLGSHFVGKKLLVERMLGKVFVLPASHWSRLNLCWVLFFVVQAVANVVVAAHFSEAFWVGFKTFGDLGLMIVFMVGQFIFLRKYVVAQPQETAVKVPEIAD